MYRFDLTADDRSRFKLFLMVNTFSLTGDEVQRLRALLRGTGATVVWFYAPGYIGEHKFEPSHMEELTGFTFKRMDAPGPMMIRCKIEENELKFFRLPYPMVSEQGGNAATEHRLSMQFGEVRLFVKP